MPKQGENPLWDYFKISNKNVSMQPAYFAKIIYQEGARKLTKMTTTTIFAKALAWQSGFSKILASAHP